jgi:polyhydroxyalkanoate synthase subunit PhaC
VRFVTSNLVEAAAPSNNPLISPVGWKAVIDTAGGNVVAGSRQLVGDLASSPRVPSMVEPDAYEVGEDLALTPGAVVLRTPVFALIQYRPQTPTVRALPLLVVPPTINKYYILDLAPGRSLVEYLVEQGHQVFVMSWRNPTLGTVTSSGTTGSTTRSRAGSRRGSTSSTGTPTPRG